MAIHMGNGARFAVLFMVGLSLTACMSAGGPSMPRASGGSTPAASNVALTPTPVSIPTSGQGLIGGPVARGLSGNAQRQALEAEYRALEHTQPNQAVAWNDGRGTVGEVKAATPYSVGSQNCRQFTHSVTPSSGQPQNARGTACRNSDGSWALLN